MAAFSDDERRVVEETYIDSPTSLHPMPTTLWEASLEVWVNGQLRIPGADFSAAPEYLFFAEELLEGDTVRLSGPPS